MELGGRDTKSKLNKYVNEDCEDDSEKFENFVVVEGQQTWVPNPLYSGS